MNPDQQDPKYQSSPVHPGANWGGGDRASKIPQAALPPRKSDGVIPTKEELNPVLAKRHVPHLKLCDDDSPELIESLIMDVKSPENSTSTAAYQKEPKKVSKRFLNQQDRDSLAKSADDSPNQTFVAGTSVAASKSAPESDPEEKEILLPVTLVSESNRFRVNENFPPQHLDNEIKKTRPVTSHTVGKWASNEEVMQNESTQIVDVFSSDLTNVRQTLVWITCAGVMIIFIVGGAILLKRPPKDDSDIPKLSTYNNTNEEIDTQGGTSHEMLISGEAQAKKIFAKYATSKSMDDIVDIIYLQSKNENLISKKWEPLNIDPGWKAEENFIWIVTEAEDIEYGILSGTLPNFSRFNAVFRMEGGAMKLDWKATSGFSSVNCSLLKKGEGAGEEIRALLSLGDFHTFTLPETEFRCYHVTDADNEEHIWAYTKRGGIIDQMLLSQLIPSQITGEAVTQIPIMLVLARGSEQSLPNQWIINNVVRLNWLDE